TGLGLAIASEVVQMHRGELTLEALAEGGTRATIRLPAEDAGAGGAALATGPRRPIP
ncbi:MAG: sensor histidine kinase, partial [Myxococcales bacterium]|nr:sensor histidine kinase [Myxococcales bacterium]